jgi:6-pyruvoyl-tetrahydropterin synthase
MFVEGRFLGASFNASRRVSHAPHGGNRLHGHTYELAVRLKRKPVVQTKLIFPFEELASIVRRICEELNKSPASVGRRERLQGGFNID